jgi:hypothetical protein
MGTPELEGLMEGFQHIEDNEEPDLVNKWWYGNDCIDA